MGHGLLSSPIGIALTGNLLGLTKTEFDSLSKESIQAHRETISAKLYQAGAHYVVDGIWDVPAVLDDIQECLRQGLRP
jgi:phosphonoacetaldehyde hydrolase